MFCPKCGNKLSDNSKYCGKCGNQISIPGDDQPTPAAQAAPTAAGQPAPAASPTQPSQSPRSNTQANSASASPLGSKLQKAALAKNSVLKYVAIIACAVGIGAFLFLPIVGASASVLGFGVSVSFTGCDFMFGFTKKVLGQTYSQAGVLYAGLFVLPLALVLLASIIFRGKVCAVLQTLFGVLSLAAVIIMAVNFSSYAGGTSGVVSSGIQYGMGFWLFLIASIVVLVVGIAAHRQLK